MGGCVGVWVGCVWVVPSPRGAEEGWQGIRRPPSCHCHPSPWFAGGRTRDSNSRLGRLLEFPRRLTAKADAFKKKGASLLAQAKAASTAVAAPTVAVAVESDDDDSNDDDDDDGWGWRSKAL